MKKRMKGTRKGIKKVKDDLYRFVSSRVFNESITVLRGKYNIPNEGFQSRRDLFGKERDATFYPKEWDFYKNKKITKELSKDIIEMATSFPLMGFEWNNIFSTYLFFNYIPEDILNEHISKDNLCKIADLRAEFGEYDFTIINPIENEREKSMIYPIAIKITPYASQRTIVNFIQENLQQIQLLQNKYKDQNVTLGKTRSRAIKEQDFIYKHRAKPRKIIAELADKKFFGEHRPESIRMTISRKKRGG